MTIVVGVKFKNCNFIYADTAVTSSAGLDLVQAFKIGRLSSAVLYAIAGDANSAYTYLSKLKTIISSVETSTRKDVEDKLRFSIADNSSYRNFEVILSFCVDGEMLMFRVSSAGNIVEIGNNSLTMFGSGADQSKLGSVLKYIETIKDQPLAQFGLSMSVFFNDWIVGPKQLEGMQSGIGGAFVYYVHTKEGFRQPAPTLNAVTTVIGGRVKVLTTGTMGYRGMLIVSIPGEVTRRILVSNMDFEYQNVLEEFMKDEETFYREVDSKFITTSFKRFTFHEEFNKEHGGGPIEDEFIFDKSKALEVPKEITYCVNRFLQRNSLSEEDVDYKI